MVEKEVKWGEGRNEPGSVALESDFSVNLCLFSRASVVNAGVTGMCAQAGAQASSVRTWQETWAPPPWDPSWYLHATSVLGQPEDLNRNQCTVKPRGRWSLQLWEICFKNKIRLSLASMGCRHGWVVHSRERHPNTSCRCGLKCSYLQRKCVLDRTCDYHDVSFKGSQDSELPDQHLICCTFQAVEHFPRGQLLDIKRRFNGRGLLSRSPQLERKLSFETLFAK